jgi:hypothetical protein
LSESASRRARIKTDAARVLANDDDAPNDAASPPSTQHNSPALAKSAVASRTEETKTS